MQSRIHGGVRLWWIDLPAQRQYRTRSEFNGRYFIIAKDHGSDHYGIHEAGASPRGFAAWRGVARTLADAGRFLRKQYGLRNERDDDARS